jgi:hypothetical protein
MPGTIFPGTIVPIQLEGSVFRLLFCKTLQPQDCVMSETRCANPACRMLNRVSAYSINQIPRCPKCGWVLPENTLTKLYRAAYSTHPALWIALGGGTILIGLSFLDRYAPHLGLPWNIINGTINGVAYRYVFALGIILILFGGWLWARK